MEGEAQQVNTANTVTGKKGNESSASSSTRSSGGGSNSIMSFCIYFLIGRWFYMFAAILIMAGAGATYLFGVYSKEIKATLGNDQTTLNLLGFFKDLGANGGVLSGLLDEVAKTWFVLLFGASMNFTGYFMIYLAVARKIPTPKVWHMCLYICIGANSHTEAMKDLAKRGINRSSIKELTCIGSKCYRMAFSVLACITFFGALSSLILVARTKEFYKGDIYKRSDETDEAEADVPVGKKK
ncbi:hypothetical protein LIER_24106 [Lithospermum erythrorhizon]|uniref:Nodulin-like domain-containing protein n=1 Tax=Lithospermum erythrorhizon TaxID=34254 RepID=A0AAV3R1C0_LITER